VVTVTTSREGEPRGEILRWGLVPHWADSPKVGFKLINARAETAHDKPAFRDAFKSKRCLVLADGFYEWQQRPGLPKLPWWVSRADGAPFAFAGLWSIWHGAEGESLRTCTILTTAANAAVADVHDRMPVMLDGPDAEGAWLDPGTPAGLLHDLLNPWPDELTARRAVSSAVGDARYDGPDCLADADPADSQPHTLF
jgi:putative SOS response-associated peptidase YedK